nr:MAG TPA: hypothetical protein [Caudoviricetes sp.]
MALARSILSVNFAIISPPLINIFVSHSLTLT